MGTLKIYLNGVPIYKVKNWEEIIPSERSSDNGIYQIWGGGTTGSYDIHEGNFTLFNLKKIKYFEEPLNFVHVRHHYLTEIKPLYNITECQTKCVDNLYGFNLRLILTEDGDYLITEDNNFITY